MAYIQILILELPSLWKKIIYKYRPHCNPVHSVFWWIPLILASVYQTSLYLCRSLQQFFFSQQMLLSSLTFLLHVFPSVQYMCLWILGAPFLPMDRGAVDCDSYRCAAVPQYLYYACMSECGVTHFSVLPVFCLGVHCCIAWCCLHKPECWSCNLLFCLMFFWWSWLFQLFLLCWADHIDFFFIIL